MSDDHSNEILRIIVEFFFLLFTSSLFYYFIYLDYIYLSSIAVVKLSGKITVFCNASLASCYLNYNFSNWIIVGIITKETAVETS